jgi:hypothetical protein
MKYLVFTLDYNTFAVPVPATGCDEFLQLLSELEPVARNEKKSYLDSQTWSPRRPNGELELALVDESRIILPAATEGTA